MEATKTRLEDIRVRIYSKEHHAFWREDYCGYTLTREHAGIYTLYDAWWHTKHCGPEKQIMFEPVRDE